MNAKGLRLIRSLNGWGRIYRGEQLIITVSYSLKEVEELLEYEPSTQGTAPAGEAAGQRSVYGFLNSPQADLLYQYLGSRLTLHTDDGHVLDFAVTRQPDKTSCLICSLGDFREKSELLEITRRSSG